MSYKVNENKWQELIYFINNFFKPVAYTCGRGVYPDRITMVRGKSYFECLAPEKDVEFYTFNARSTEMSSVVVLKIRELVEKYITDPHFMNETLNIGNKQRKDYTKLFDYVQKSLLKSKIVDFEKINDFIVKAFKKLEPKDLLKITQFRESAIDICIKEEFFSEQFGKEQKELLPNSLLRLTTDFDS